MSGIDLIFWACCAVLVAVGILTWTQSSKAKKPKLRVLETPKSTAAKPTELDKLFRKLEEGLLSFVVKMQNGRILVCTSENGKLKNLASIELNESKPKNILQAGDIFRIEYRSMPSLNEVKEDLIAISDRFKWR